jgi:predicted nucleic acid-binding protein
MRTGINLTKRIGKFQLTRGILEDPAREPDTEKALALVESVVRGRLEILQPVHWLAEVAAVAVRLAIETNHHLFDTLYHAVALEHEDAILVTADDRYYKKAERHGTIAALRDWVGVP